ncbi:hypothetical protein HPB52_001566 [Rhipicephalus sanguineus]|uniref:Uncharacterized protein n=1 Tax=Rhipicephalus sanguineus TaxID=34632 RepID=A0A9D4PHD1_RHISA|nr:hypothetical protein HPB52_001566 [Rhipicephalus sanguineus]
MGTQTDTRTPLEASYLSGPECAQSSPPWRFEPARGSTPVPDTTEEADNGELSSVAPEIDTTYQPSFDESFASDTEPTASPQDESKFLVFRGCLEPLLLKCRICLSTCVNKYMVLGTMLTVESRCKQNHVTSWQSQPMVGAKPAGNVLLAAAILFSGCPIAAVLRCLKYLNMAAINREVLLHLSEVLLAACSQCVGCCAKQRFNGEGGIGEKLRPFGTAGHHNPLTHHSTTDMKGHIQNVYMGLLKTERG